MRSFFLATFYLLLSCQISFAQKEKDAFAKPFQSEQTDSLTCQVEVTFCIDESGRAKIINIDTEDPQLVQFILEKFEKIQVSTKNYYIGKTMRYRFNFKVGMENIAQRQLDSTNGLFIPTFALNEQREKRHSDS